MFIGITSGTDKQSRKRQGPLKPMWEKGIQTAHSLQKQSTCGTEYLHKVNQE